MNVVSLFAGVGGFDLAAEAAGFTVTAQVENNKFCQKVLAHHWPNIPQYGDIHDVTASDLGTPDILCGGFPCQDYSVAGKREGLAGDRGALWWQFHRLIGETRPTWVIGENVPGLLSSDKGRAFGTIIGSLVELGYGVVWRVLDAQYFGVAQRRRRVFIVGHLGGEPRPEVLAISEGSEGHPAPSRRTQEATTATSEGGTGTSSIAATLDTRPTPDRLRVEDGHMVVAKTLMGKGQRLDSEPETFVVHATQDPVVSVERTHALGASSQQAVAFAQNQRAEIYESDVALALSGGGGKPGQGYPAIRDGMQVRRLTPLECERLQGFPDNWTSICSDTQRYRQMGNALAVPVATWIMRNTCQTS